MNALSPSLIYDSFNARFSSPERVAETFIPPECFWKLCGIGHSLVVGPRGSGKTSLLKMLQTPALRAWKHPRARQTFDCLGFIGVFIPTDVLWDEQTRGLGEDFLSHDQRQALVQSAISLQVLRSLTTAIIDEFIPANVHDHAGPRGCLRVKKEQECVDHLSTIWQVPCPVPTFKSLRRGLTSQLTKLGFFVAQERFKAEVNRNDRFAESCLLYPDFLSLSTPALEALDDALANSKLKWAFCFDELELAPPSLQQSLMRLIRSTEPRIYFKLSSSPYVANSDLLALSPSRPDQEDDFRLIPLWYAEKKKSETFCNQLAKVFLAELGRPETEPTALFEDDFSTSDSGYSKGSSNHRELCELKSRDHSFADYLEKEGIDLNKINELPEDERASAIRKIMPVVLFRNYFRRWPKLSAKQQLLRSRKSLQLYTGWNAIAAICEGNPRVLKGLITGMIKDTPKAAQKVTAAVQWKEIEDARQRFRSKLKTIPITVGGRDRGVLKMLDLVGKHFEKQLLGPKFVPEPTASFTLDAVASEQYHDAVGSALNIGGLVYLPGDKSKMILGNLREKRFRLSYLMATHYHIPLRIGPHKTLKRILDDSDESHQQLLMPDEV